MIDQTTRRQNILRSELARYQGLLRNRAFLEDVILPHAANLEGGEPFIREQLRYVTEDIRDSITLIKLLRHCAKKGRNEN